MYNSYYYTYYLIYISGVDYDGLLWYNGNRVMKRTFIQENKKRCSAMMVAGITDPEKQTGIDFCVNSCPYDSCVIMENVVTDTKRSYKERVRVATELRRRRVSVDDIALILSVKERDVRRYLKE